MTIYGIYLNNWVRTGGQRRYLELLDAMSMRGHRVFVLMDRDFEFPLASSQRIDIEVGHNTRGRRPFSVLYRQAVRRWLKSDPIELRDDTRDDRWIHIHGQLHWFAAGDLSRSLGETPIFFAFRSNSVVRNRVTVRSGGASFRRRMSLAIQNLKYRWYEREVARRAALITFQSETDEQDYLAHAPRGAGKTVVIPGAIDGPRFRDEFSLVNKSVTVERIVYVGLVDDTKGLKYLLEGYAEAVKETGCSLFLDVFGRGDRIDAMTRLARDLHVADLVFFHGQVADPFPAIAAADLMVYPSLYDAFPDVVLEALHIGVPVIATRIGGIPDILESDELLFPIMDSKAIAGRIIRCVEDPSYYRHLRELCARRREAFLFDWTALWIRAMQDRAE